MSIFGRDETEDQQPTSQPAAPRPKQPKGVKQVTHISSGTRIEGQISGATEVQIDGTVDGQIHVGSVVRIEANGQVNGEIRAKSVVVAGTVIGNIVGEDKVDIQSKGKLQGDVKAPRVSIADGSYFKGRVEMTGQTEARATAAPPAAKPAPKPAPIVQKSVPTGQAKFDSVPTSDSGKQG